MSNYQQLIPYNNASFLGSNNLLKIIRERNDENVDFVEITGDYDLNL